MISFSYWNDFGFRLSWWWVWSIWSSQVGYGDASGFLVIVSSFLSAMVLSRWVSDLTLITIGMLSHSASLFLMAFVTKTYMFYIGKTIATICQSPKHIYLELKILFILSHCKGFLLFYPQVNYYLPLWKLVCNCCYKLFVSFDC